MVTKHVNFSDQPDEANAGETEVFPVDVDDFEITVDCNINSAAFTNEQGESYFISSVLSIPTDNYFQLTIPEIIPTGHYTFKISVASGSDPTDTAIIETSTEIFIQGKSDFTKPPTVNMARFRQHNFNIPAADISSDVLVITGTNLDFIHTVRINSPSILFNIQTKSQMVMTAKPISSPQFQGMRIAYPQFSYTVVDEAGEFVSEGVIQSHLPIKIEGS